MAEWTSSDSLATKIADISGTNGTAGANGGNDLIPGTTVFESSGADTIFSDTAGSANWLLYSFTLDSVYDTKSSDVLENLDPPPADAIPAVVDGSSDVVAGSNVTATANASARDGRRNRVGTRPAAADQHRGRHRRPARSRRTGHAHALRPRRAPARIAEQ